MTKKIDENSITEYGIRIVMDEEKILRENIYSLKEIYKSIDELAEFSGMKKIDKYYYVSKNDTPSELGCFVCTHLEEKQWFMNNVKEWLWYDKIDGMHDIIDFYKKKKLKNEKIS